MESGLYVTNVICTVCILLLILVGLIGNALSLTVVIYSYKSSSRTSFQRHSSQNNSQEVRGHHLRPKINCKKYLIVFLSTNIVFLLAYFYTVTLNNLIYISGIQIRVDYDANAQFASSFANNNFFVRYNLVDTNRCACQISYFIRSLCRLINAFTIAFYSFERLLAVYHPISAIVSRRLFRTVSRACYVALIAVSVVYSGIIMKSFDVATVNQNATVTNSTWYTQSRFHPYWLMPTYTSSKCRMWAFYGRTTNKIIYRIYYFSIIGCHIFVCLSIFLILMKMKLSKSFKSHREAMAMSQRHRMAGSETTISSYFIEPGAAWPRRHMLRHYRHRLSKWPLLTCLVLSLVNIPVCVLSFNYLIRTTRQGGPPSSGTVFTERGPLVLFVFNLQILNHSVSTLMMLIFSKLYRQNLSTFARDIWRSRSLLSIFNVKSANTE